MSIAVVEDLGVLNFRKANTFWVAPRSYMDSLVKERVFERALRELRSHLCRLSIASMDIRLVKSRF